jgi:crotonobetainyl-CoA:carnitine CoA-transferase CaiB-like acyl-CoA transferase
VAIDIQTAEGVARLKALVKDADILIQNLRPGLVEKFGIGPEDLRAVNPRLIYCNIWAFGSKGPMKLAPGFDPLLQSFGAVVTLTGRPEDPPTFCAPAINDKATGMWCVIGALGALQQRARTGLGCTIDTSLFESACAWVEGPLNNYQVTGKVPERHGTGSNIIVPYQIFDTADRPLCIAAGNDRLFVKMADAMGHPEWYADPRFSDGRKRTQNREALIALMEPVVAARTRADWIELLGKVGVPCAAVNDIAELSASEQLAAVDMMRTLPGSNLRVVGLPISFDGERPHPRTDSPKVGEHDREVFGG